MIESIVVVTIIAGLAYWAGFRDGEMIGRVREWKRSTCEGGKG